MRLKSDVVGDSNRQKLMIQSGGRKMLLFGDDDEDCVIKEVFEALSVLLDI